MTTLALILSALALIAAAHTAIFAATTGWHCEQVRLWPTRPDEARRRKACPPWFVRYTTWLP